MIGERDTPEWLDVSLLGYLGQQRQNAIQQYRAFVEEVNIDNVVNPDSLSFGNCILGGTGFVHWVQETFLANEKDDKEIPQIKKLWNQHWGHIVTPNRTSIKQIQLFKLQHFRLKRAGLKAGAV